MPADLPVIGACLPVEALAQYRDWLFEADRDIEIQTFFFADVLDGDWQPLADEARKQLDGHKGRIGFTGPSGALPSTRWTRRSGGWSNPA